MNFIHLCGVNLDSSGEKLPGCLIDRGQDAWEDFRQVLSVCREEKTDLLLITGDLFSREPSEQELLEVNEAFSELSDTRVFYLTGRADAGPEPSEILSFAWAQNVTVLAGDCVQRIYLPKQDCEITGVGYSPLSWDKVQPDMLFRGKKGTVQILLLPELKNGKEEVSRAGSVFDYVAVGSRERLKSEKDATLFSPGALQPTEFTGQLKHGYLRGTILTKEWDRNEMDLTFVPAAGREYLTLPVSADREAGLQEVEQKVRDTIRVQGPENIYRIVLTGEASPALYYLKDRLRSLGNIPEIEDRTVAGESLRNLREKHAEDAAERFVRKLPDADEETLEKAVRYGIEALLEGGESGK